MHQHAFNSTVQCTHVDWISRRYDRKKGLYHLAAVVRRCNAYMVGRSSGNTLASAPRRGPHTGVLVLRQVHPSPGDMMMAGRGACMPYVHDEHRVWWLECCIYVSRDEHAYSVSSLS